jgi:hypothetical protein
LVKLLNLKEILTSRQFLSIEEGKVKGKYQVALQSLIGFLADTKQATHDLQNALQEAMKEMKTVEKRI